MPTHALLAQCTQAHNISGKFSVLAIPVLHRLNAKDATLRLSVSAGLRLRTSVFAVCQRGLGEDYLQLPGASSPNRTSTLNPTSRFMFMGSYKL